MTQPWIKRSERRIKPILCGLAEGGRVLMWLTNMSRRRRIGRTPRFLGVDQRSDLRGHFRSLVAVVWAAQGETGQGQGAHRGNSKSHRWQSGSKPCRRTRCERRGKGNWYPKISDIGFRARSKTSIWAVEFRLVGMWERILVRIVASTFSWCKLSLLIMWIWLLSVSCRYHSKFACSSATTLVDPPRYQLKASTFSLLISIALSESHRTNGNPRD
jgi:hypothetical protein